MDRVNNYPAVRLRSYMIDQHPPAYPDVKVWEAARATSAAPHYFKPMVINGDKLVDGGLKANNPAREYVLDTGLPVDSLTASDIDSCSRSSTAMASSAQSSAS